MAVCEQLALFDLAPYIVSHPSGDDFKLVKVQGDIQRQFQDIQLELEFPTEVKTRLVYDLGLAA
jgi:hypothetical protein